VSTVTFGDDTDANRERLASVSNLARSRRDQDMTDLGIAS